jgi:FAD/FMN-containing dehydrogenase
MCTSWYAFGGNFLANWDKLQRLKAKHDPQGLFFDFTGGLT